MIFLLSVYLVPGAVENGQEIYERKLSTTSQLPRNSAEEVDSFWRKSTAKQASQASENCTEKVPHNDYIGVP